jgi:predicted SprT family Zn-dependent metalloprotease
VEAVVEVVQTLLQELLAQAQAVAVMDFNNQQLQHKVEQLILAVVEVVVAHLILMQMAVQEVQA